MTGFNSKRDAAADKLQEPAQLTEKEKISRQMTAEIAAARALAQPAQESLEDLRGALHRIDTVAVGLPTFEVRHEGGLDAVVQNIVDAIVALHEQRKPLTDADYVNACISYRHDFGLITQEQRDKLIFQAREWARAFGMNEVAHGIKGEV